MRTAPQVAYVIWIAVATVGLLQAFASHYGWAGLSFFRANPRLGYLCAVVLIPASYYWFFSLTDRNVPGLEGWQLFSRFVIGVAGGLVIALTLSSVLNASMTQPRPRSRRSPVHLGLDALRDDTYLHLLGTEVRYSPPLRLLRAAQRHSWTRVLSLLRHVSAAPQPSHTPVRPSERRAASRGDS